MPIEPFIKCSDITASLRFYTAVLDFSIRQPPDPDPQAFMSMYALIERAGSLVHLSAHAGDGAYGSLNYIRVDNLDELYQQYVERGLNVTQPQSLPGIRIKPVQQTWGMKEFSIADPDGNRLTFGESIDA